MSKVALGIAAAVLGLWSFIPVYWVLNLGFQLRADIFTVPPYLAPPRPTLDNFLRAFGFVKEAIAGTLAGLGLVPQFQAGIVNSMIVASATTLLTIVLSMPAGYAFARFSFPMRTTIFFIILFARSLPPISTVIPYYQLYSITGMLGTHIGLVLIHMTLTVPLVTWVLSGFFSSLPVEIDKAARIDGCSRLQMFLKILLPLAAPGVAASAILTFLTSWNEFIFALILASASGLWTLSPAVAAPIFGVGSDIELYAAFASIAVIPALVAAIFLQRYITRLRIVDPVTYRLPT